MTMSAIATIKLMFLPFGMFLKPWPSTLQHIAGFNYSAKWDIFNQKYFFQNSIAKKFYSENDNKIKIIPCAYFLHSVNCRLKLF
jgi:hypothetical protein